MDQNENNSHYEEQEINMKNFSNETLYCVLSYIFIFWILGLLMARENNLVKFHVNQGIILSIVSIFSLFILNLLSDILYFIAPILAIVSSFLEILWILATLIFVIIGIKNSLNHKQTPLPIFGSLFNFVR